jgi:hypothetical protein
MQENNATKKQILQTLTLIWLAWFIGNICANALFYLGADFKTQLPADFQSVTYHWGTLIYYITVSVVGIASSHYYIKSWKLPTDLIDSPKNHSPVSHLKSRFVCSIHRFGSHGHQPRSPRFIERCFLRKFRLSHLSAYHASAYDGCLYADVVLPVFARLNQGVW